MDKTEQRSRSSNFTPSEMEELLLLVEAHKHIVECKKTDALSNGEKEAEWEKIASKFNAALGTGRTSKNLRNKWDAWKKSTKKEYSAKKCILYKTGGGPYTDIKLGNWGDRVLNIIGVSATGKENKFDSDNLGEGFVHDGVVEATDAPLHTLRFLDDNIIVEVIDDQTLEETSNKESTSMNLLEENTTECSQQDKKFDWDHWNPALLKTKAHSALSLNSDKIKIGTPTSTNASVSRKRNRSEINTSRSRHEEMMGKKIELLELQSALLKKEYEEKSRMAKEKHELDMKISMENEKRAQEKHLEMEILRKKFNQ